jgi:hypothetical protein
MALTMVPYLWCWWHTPPGRQFCWVLYGRDDHAVYMAWMRQAAEGRFFFRNLFTTDPQGRGLPNLFFWLLAQPVRFLGASPALMLQLARLWFGALLLVLIYRFASYFTESLVARRATFWLAALSAGAGWGLMLGWYGGMEHPPTDFWQPEGFTYFSIYSTALFAAATCGIVGILCLLLEAERTGRRRCASWAGLVALLLGNFHSYDILHLAAAWGLYLLIKTGIQLARREGMPRRSWGDAAACAVIGMPSTLLQYYFYRSDPVFHQRADYPTPSPEFASYALGYGLVLLLALAGAVLLLRGRSPLKTAQRWMPMAWVIAGFGVAYLPLSFNRKMIMGTHVPLCLLAGIAAAALTERIALERKGVPTSLHESAKGRKREKDRRSVDMQPGRRFPSILLPLSRFRPGYRRSEWTFSRENIGIKTERRTAAVIGLIVLLTVPTNALRALEDIAEAGDRPQDLNWISAYWPEADLKAMAWIRTHTPADAAFFCTPLSGRYIAAVAGRAVYAGHWGETPRFAERVGATIGFFQQPQGPDQRLLQLHGCATQYVYQGTTEQRSGRVDLSRDPGLEEVYEADGVRIYRVKA